MQADSTQSNRESALGIVVISTLMARWIVAFNAHAVEQMVELYAEDAELFDSGMRHARKGRHEIASWFVRRFQQIPTIEYTPLQSFLREREGTIHWVVRGQTPPLLQQHWLARSFEIDGISLFRVDRGLISWQHGYYDHLHLVEKVFPPLRWLPLRL